MRTKKVFINNIGLIFLSISIASIFLQFFSDNYSNLISPMLIVSFFLFFIYQPISKKNLYYILFAVGILTYNLMQSILIQENLIPNAIRFYLILILVPLSLTLKLEKKIGYTIIMLVFLFCLFLIYQELYYISHPNTWIVDRQIWKSKGIGDVYSFNGFFYKIQIKGNALIPATFFASNYIIRNRKIKMVLTPTFIIAILIAGNTMYLVSLVLFYIIKYLTNIERKIKLSIKGIIMFFLMIILFIVSIFNLKNQFILKVDNSYPIRTDQLNVLLTDLTENSYSLFFGKGLGNFVNSTTSVYRDYSSSIYFELQIFYILNQLGIILFFFYIFIIYKLIKLNWNTKEQYIVFISYCIYAVTNPYIFDATNIVIFMLISTMAVRKERYNEY